MKPSQVSNVKIIWPKTPLGPFWRFPEMVNLISSVIIAILSYRKDFTTLYNKNNSVDITNFNCIKLVKTGSFYLNIKITKYHTTCPSITGVKEVL